MKRMALLAGVGPLILLITILILDGDRSYNQWLAAGWGVSQTGVLMCLYLIYRNNWTGPSLIGKVILLIPMLGALSYMAGELQILTSASPIKIFLPMGALLSGTGMILCGSFFVKNGLQNGLNRFAALSVGLYPFLVMFPVLMVTGHPSIHLIMLWGAPWLWLGLLLQKLTTNT